MKTAFQTGPGFFAVDTSDHRADIPPKTMRIYCARLEAYDLPLDKTDDGIQFEILFAKAQDNPEIARAILKLGKATNGNKAELLKQIS